MHSPDRTNVLHYRGEQVTILMELCPLGLQGKTVELLSFLCSLPVVRMVQACIGIPVWPLLAVGSVPLPGVKVRHLGGLPRLLLKGRFPPLDI